jgi:hypothetical protein
MRWFRNLKTLKVLKNDAQTNEPVLCDHKVKNNEAKKKNNVWKKAGKRMKLVSEEIVAQVGPHDRLKFEEIDITRDENCYELCNFLNTNYSQVDKGKQNLNFYFSTEFL